MILIKMNLKKKTATTVCLSKINLIPVLFFKLKISYTKLQSTQINLSQLVLK